ncbi:MULTISPECIES: hypothetical protein [unclassified Microcoleus]|uniref:hypothetical protein n=1 Tax=unclassified Microcoleus TaxID=2642155 RepID=UPI002FD03B16
MFGVGFGRSSCREGGTPYGKYLAFVLNAIIELASTGRSHFQKRLLHSEKDAVAKCAVNTTAKKCSFSQ